MANIARWAPFDDIDELFKGVFLRPMRPEAPDTQVRVRMDVREDDKAYLVHAEIGAVRLQKVRKLFKIVQGS